eukprot:43845-Prorocentrum_minimum.AAC.1
MWAEQWSEQYLPTVRESIANTPLLPGSFLHLPQVSGHSRDGNEHIPGIFLNIPRIFLENSQYFPKIPGIFPEYSPDFPKIPKDSRNMLGIFSEYSRNIELIPAVAAYRGPGGSRGESRERAEHS